MLDATDSYLNSVAVPSAVAAEHATFETSRSERCAAAANEVSGGTAYSDVLIGCRIRLARAHVGYLKAVSSGGDPLPIGAGVGKVSLGGDVGEVDLVCFSAAAGVQPGHYVFDLGLVSLGVESNPTDPASGHVDEYPYATVTTDMLLVYADLPTAIQRIRLGDAYYVDLTNGPGPENSC